jgi:CubicO group peptidase (beta-lactamase class C family)
MTNMKLQEGHPKDVNMSDERLRHVAKLVESWVNQGNPPGIVVLAARRGRIVLHEAFGRLTSEPDSPAMPRDAIFPLTSLSKPVTATATMILVEEGLLGLNRPVSFYIPEFLGEGKGKVMVHHLLTHTSGLTEEEVDAQIEKKKRDSVEISPPERTQHAKIHERLSLAYDTPLTFAPGTEQRYCNFGVELLGEIVRRISGKALPDFAQERLFGPLGMTDTSYGVPTAVRHRVVKRPADSPIALIDSQEFQETPWAYCGAFSTVRDMAVLGQMYLNGGIYDTARIFSPVTVAEMTRNQIPGISARFVDEVFPEAGTGFSWFIRGNKKAVAYGETLQSPKAFCHGGAGGVFFWVDPAHEIVGCYFSVHGGPITVADSYLHSSVDLFINAVMAAIVGPA